MATTVWFNVFPATEKQSGSTVPPGTVPVAAVVGSAAYNAWDGNGSYQGWQVFTGPFTSETEAAADLKASHPGPGPIQGFASGVALGAGGQSPNAALNTGQAAQNAANSLTGLAAIGDFFARLTKANTWIRLAKVVIGGVLLMTGIAHISGASGAAADFARKVPLPV
jgi:hypothetical protein